MFCDHISIQCPECSYETLVSQATLNLLKSTKRNFYCINGHSQAFSGPTAIEKENAELKKQIAREKQLREEADARATRAAATADHVKREAARDKNKCSNCTKRFETPEALARHVRRVHEKGPKRLPANAGESN